MIHAVGPRQNRLFDPFEGMIPPAGRRILSDGWQGVFRHVLLEEMPVGELAQHFSPTLGAPTKELFAMAGLVFLADFFDWSLQDAVEAYIFRVDVQYALNLEPGVSVSGRTLERYQKLFRDDELAAQVFHEVTTRLADELELDITQQRLDSTHVFSHMASFGRTKLMAVAIKRFLTQVIRHEPTRYAALPEAFRLRYHTRDDRYELEFSDQDLRLAGRRREQETPVFDERYARRAGIESTNSGLKNRLGLDRLRVRGRGSVFRVILHKVAGWNVLRAAASEALRARVRAQVARTLKVSEFGPIQRLCNPVVRPRDGLQTVCRTSHSRPHGFAVAQAA